MPLAPIVLFVYNRPWHTQQTVEALQRCELAAESDLYIFADGAKPDANAEQLDRIRETREYVHSISGFKEVYVEEAETNKGLANSVINGVTKVVNKYGKVIVLEDDIVTSRGFLRYMNNALDTYEEETQVMHISGYMYPLKKNTLPTTFFYPAASCWGWATWKRAWSHFNPDASFLYDQIKKQDLLDVLNVNSIHGFEKQLKDNAEGRLKTWFIKWNASVILERGYSLYPKYSLVKNIGFDGSGEHCGSSTAFSSTKLINQIKVKKQKIEFNDEAIRLLKEFCDFEDKESIGFLKKMRRVIKKIIRKIVRKSVPELAVLDRDMSWGIIENSQNEVSLGNNVKVYSPYHISNSKIGDYSYIAQNPYISMTTIGKFCSIGPNLVCGWGIHPITGISTSPMFYSTMKQNGMTLSAVDKVEERKPITIGNDVFIGANVTILDGITIGDGAVIGAGAVVSQDIPPYAVAVGCPIRIIKYRFQEEQISALQKIKWWEYDEEKLREVEQYFFDVDGFIELNAKGGIELKTNKS